MTCAGAQAPSREFAPEAKRTALRVLLIAPSTLLTDHRPHGDGLLAFGFVRELAARGHELHVVAGNVDLRDPLPSGVELYEDGGAELGRAARLRFMRRLRRIHRRLRRTTGIDLVHQLTPVEVGVSLALSRSHTPLVLGPYVPDWPPSGPGADARVGRAALRAKRALRAAEQRRARLILLSTRAAESKLERRPGPGLEVRELPFGIDERTWHPAPAHDEAEDVLFLASVDVRKGIHVLLDAFSMLAPRRPSARLFVAGTGAELDAVRTRVERSPDLERVTLLGQVERGQVLATMQSCDVYCLPSYSEPFGLSALEAMACGKPVVATDAGGLGRLVPKRGGYRVPPGDPAALAAALQELLESPSRRAEMGEHNRRVVTERYAWGHVVDRLEEAYDAALRGRSERMLVS
jgi:L-malate glycosyltransferase